MPSIKGYYTRRIDKSKGKVCASDSTPPSHPQKAHIFRRGQQRRHVVLLHAPARSAELPFGLPDGTIILYQCAEPIRSARNLGGNGMTGFAWTDFYAEFASALLVFAYNRATLIEKIKQIYSNTGLNLPKLEKDNEIVDIDPFTVFGLFNRNLSDKNVSLSRTRSRCCSRFRLPCPKTLMASQR